MAGTNQDDPRSATWWPELLRLKDSLSWAALSEKFGVGAHALRRALTEAGETKASIPPGRKPQGAKAAAAPKAAPPANPLAALAGKKSDPEVAREARLSIAEVKAYRKANGIAPFLKGPPAIVATPAPAPAPAADKAAVVRRRTKAGDVKETRHVAPTAPPPAAPAPAAAKAVAAKPAEKAVAKAVAKPAAKSGLDAFRDQMGKVQDDVIAQSAGVHRLEVGAYRRKLGIPAYNGHRFRKGDAPVAAKAAPVETPAAQRASAIDPYASLLGTVPDSEIATLAGVTVEAVKKFRQRRNIARFVGPKEDAVKPAEVKPAVVEPAVVEAPAPKRRGRPPGRKNGEGKAALAKAAAAAKAAEVKPAEVKPAAVKPAEAKAAERPPRKSALLPFVHLIGVLSDREVAEKAKVTVENVRMWRTRRGIPSVSARAATNAPAAPVAAAPAPVVEAVVAPVAAAKPVVEKAAPAAPVAPKKVAAPAAAPKAAEAAPAAPAPAGRHAFQVSVYSGDRKRDFALIAADVVDAARSASEALSRRDDGPWRIQVIRELAESLE